jgi:3-oxoacyl-[acyl-carrier-protein] synthase-3
MGTSATILSVGMHLPPQVRRNDWWTQEVVASWHTRPQSAGPGVRARTPAEARILDEMSKQAVDPFQGSVTRYVMPDDMTLVDLEAQAAKEAIDRAHLAPDAIDAILGHSVSPDRLLGNPTTSLHARLGIKDDCLSLQVDAAPYSFIGQLTLADALIRAGEARHVLLVQSSAASRLVDPTSPISPIFGDGATAVIIGPTTGEGILGAVHYTDGRYPDTLVASVPGGRWFDPGRVTIHIPDPALMGDVLLQTADVCKRSIAAVLAKCARRADSVDFLCMYQGTPWLQAIVRDICGFKPTIRCSQTFSTVGHLFSAMLPAGLYLAQRTGALHENDLVIVTGGGTGMTYGAVLLRWGASA